MRKRAWLSAALASGALLLVPFLVWLILPSPPKIGIPEIVAATFEAPPPPPPRPRATAPSSPQRPVEAEAPHVDAEPVRGRVLGPDGGPVARAWVGCTDREISTVTDHDGTYQLPVEAIGCVANARKPGFGASQDLTLKAGSERANTFELQGGGRIEGDVVDEKGAPVPRFMLAVEKFFGAEGDDEGSHGRARTIENEQGHFAMENVTPGKYVLSVSAEGRPPARSDTLVVESGRSVKGVRIVLSNGAVLSGVITDADTRKPIAGARVALDAITSSGVSSIPSVKSDETGTYTLEGVPAKGPFSIRVEKDGYRSRIVSGLETRGSGKIASDVALQPRGEGTSGNAELGGIGITVAPQPGALGAMVLNLVPDGPAARAGLQRMDKITRIDGASTETLTLVECIQRMRGEPGTRVTVTVTRGAQELTFNLTRAVVVQ